MIGAGIGASNVAGNTRLQYATAIRRAGQPARPGHCPFFLVAFGFDALGGLLAGSLAARFGVLAVVFGQGVLLAGACLWLLPRLPRSVSPGQA